MTKYIEYPSPGVIENVSSNFHSRTIILMVGLPLMGKSFIAHKLKRFLSWLGFNTKVFHVDKRFKQQERFLEDKKIREECEFNVLNELIDFNNSCDCCVSIFDSSNCSKERREKIYDSLIANLVVKDINILWIESTCGDKKMMENVFKEFARKKADVAYIKRLEDKVEHYKNLYESFDDDDSSYIKIHEFRKITCNRIEGFIPAKILYFLSNVKIDQNPIFFSRHGESEYNVLDKVGGDSPLSPKGRLYAKSLGNFIANQPELNAEDTQIFCSTLKRTIETVALAGCDKLRKTPVQWRALSEIEVGVCDGMSYQQFKEGMPAEYLARDKDKLRYRYPQGESYRDLIIRVEPFLLELERTTSPVFVVAHRAVLRCLYGYFCGVDEEKIPHLQMPLNTVIKLEPFAFGCTETKYSFEEGSFDYSEEIKYH